MKKGGLSIKSLIANLLIFGVLIGVNLMLVKSYTGRQKKLHANLQVLDEISASFSSETQFEHSNVPLVLGEFTTKIEAGDGRVANLKSFFRKYNSVLYDYADVIVEVSDEYGFDYRLIPAIAMQESNLCKYIPENSHNCWGWGIYGDLVTRFDSYDEGIRTVAKGLKTHYIDKGLVTASAIMEKYTPSSNGSWAHGVNTFLQLLQ